jgi:hypothetical protein
MGSVGIRSSFICLCFLWVVQVGLQGEQAVNQYRIKRTTGHITVDGHIKEKAWEDAAVVEVNLEIFPGESTEAPVQTRCFIVYDDTNLYVGFKADDPNPRQIRAHLSDRDSILADDMVAIFLDTFNDENRAFAFFCNPLGIQMDQISSDGGTTEDPSWDAIWDSAGHINEKGFEVEMAIPFRSLQFQRLTQGQTWGVGLLRNWPRSQLHQIANFRHNRNNSCFLCQFPKFTGIQGAAPGKNIELDPTLTAVQTDARKNFPTDPLTKVDSKMELGISGRWGFTSNLNLSATVNPDFSQVEADAAQLDINTQFTLFYPEKRPFFLEGTDFFSTLIGGVYTRTLADPSWGVKVSGKEKKNALGFFISRDEITNLIFPGAEGSTDTTLDQGAMAAVLRYRRDLGSSSTLGILVTDREGENYYNRLAGVDGLLRFSKSDTLRFQVLGSSTRYPDSTAREFQQKIGDITGYAAHLSYLRQARTYGWEIRYEDFSPDFRADLGFIPQVNYRNGTLGLNYVHWGKAGAFLSFFEARGQAHQTLDHSGDLLEREASLQVELEMPLQTIFKVTAGVRKKIFNLVPFNQDFMEIYFKTQPSGKLYLQCRTKIQDEIDFKHTRPGKLLSIEPKTTLNFGKHLVTSLSYSYSYLDVQGGRLYSAHLLQGRLVYHFNKRAFLRGIIQFWDISRDITLYSSAAEPKSETLFTQFLFSYKINPRTVLFLGYSDNYLGLVDVDLKQQNRTFFLKIGYALSL